MELNRLKITRAVLVAGVPCAAGAIIEVSDEAAYDLLNQGVAQIEGEETRARFKSRVVRGDWRDPAQELDRTPVLRIVKNAA